MRALAWRRMASSASSSTQDERVLAISCLTRLGQFGNQLFQYAFLRVLADANSLRSLCPAWLGAKVFGLSDGLLETWVVVPLVADRVVLSHAGWRRWAATREPLRSLMLRAGGQPLSGRRLRADFPQVSGDSLAHATECAASGGSVDLWGWFQFHTSVWAPHAHVWRTAFQTVPALHAALSAALQRLLASAGQAAAVNAPPSSPQRRRLVVLHLRAGGSRAPAPPPQTTTAEAPPDWSCSEWEDRNTFWPAPTEWYLRWLSERADAERWGGAPTTQADTDSGGAPPSVVVLVCSDCEATAAAAREAVRTRLAGRCQPLSWADVAASDECAELRRVWSATPRAGGGGDDGAAADDDGDERSLALFRDWWTMGQADVLACSNSTFSFTAAMLNRADAEDGLATPRFWRPVPDARALQPFEPWSAQPLLQCSDAQASELYGERGAYE